MAGSLPTKSKVVGDGDELLEPQWVGELHGQAKASGGHCPAARCACCAVKQAAPVLAPAPRQGAKQAVSLENTCYSCEIRLCVFNLQKKHGVYVPGGQGTSMTRPGGKMDQGNNVPGQERTKITPRLIR